MDKRFRFGSARGVAYSWLLPLLAGILLGAIFHNTILPDPSPSKDIPKEAGSEFQLMAEAWNAIDSQFVDRPNIQPRRMAYGAIEGMVESLGDTGHSGFLTPDMLKAEKTIEVGSFAGIGAEIQVKNNRVTIVAPLDGSPAQKAGVRPGDIIVAVGDVDTAGLTVQEVVERILGPAGTRVAITLEDPNTGAERTLSIRRANIALRSVTWRMLPGTHTAHVRIAFFSKGTDDDLDKALAEAEKQGATGVILDLRNDAGGLLDMAVGVASRFLGDGNVLQEKNAKGAVQNIPVDGTVQKSSLPLVVLTNGGTASASEIVAGALQDAGRAKIVGETTFGTGTVLSTVPLSDGSALLLAVLEWLTPKGRTIWHKGITPDVIVALPADVSPLLPEAEAGLTVQELRSSRDTQLLRSLDILTKS